MADQNVHPHARTVGLTTYAPSEFHEIFVTWIESPDLQEISSWASSLSDTRRRLLLQVARRLVATDDYFPGGTRLSYDSYPYERSPVLGRIAERLLTAVPSVQAEGERRAVLWMADFEAYRDFTEELYTLQGELRRDGAPDRAQPDQELLAAQTTAMLIDPLDYPRCNVRGCGVRVRQLVNGMCPPALWDLRHEAAAESRVRR